MTIKAVPKWVLSKKGSYSFTGTKPRNLVAVFE